MKAEIEGVIAEVKKQRSDRRLHIFQLQVESAEANQIKLGGKVLEAGDLELLGSAVAKRFPQARVDQTKVQILRRSAPKIRSVVTNLTDLHLEPSFLSELMTQVYNGAQVEILEEQEKWSLVRQPDGYFGWAYNGFLGDGNTMVATHLVITPTANVYAEPGVSPAPLSRLLGGTSVMVIESRGDWSKIQPAGAMLPACWIATGDLRAITKHLTPGHGRQQVVSDARRWTGTYYLWGGCSAWGIDCSGLAQLSHRLSRYTLPRDADMQFEAGKVVEAPYQAGDLFFFHKESDKTKAGHVGICTGGTNMIHSSRTSNGVYEEDFMKREGLRNSFMGARAYIPR